jgi:hypothetical protein
MTNTDVKLNINFNVIKVHVTHSSALYIKETRYSTVNIKNHLSSGEIKE